MELQAQKEITHNEALALADALIQPVVEAVAPASVPASPVPGQCWIVGTGASGAWAGRDGMVAIRTAGGWRFAAPFEGMAFWSKAESLLARRDGAAWIAGVATAAELRVGGVKVVGARQPAIADPAGGATVDTEARASISAILAALRTHGLIAI